MQVVETGGAPGNARLILTWPLHEPLRSGYVDGLVELLQQVHVSQPKMQIEFRK